MLCNDENVKYVPASPFIFISLGTYLKMIFDSESSIQPMNHQPENCYLRSQEHILIKPPSNKLIQKLDQQ